MNVNTIHVKNTVKVAGDQNHVNMKISYKPDQHSFYIFFEHCNDKRILCMCYSATCVKMDAYFQDIFELITAKHRLLACIHNTTYCSRFQLMRSDCKFG